KGLKLDTRFEKINREINPKGERRMMKKVQMSDWFVNQGRVEGLEQGQAENQREIAFKMLKDGLSIDFIHKYTKLSGDEIQALQKNGQE
ncbi:MAG: hypothetical protein ACR2PY_06160, partial [Salinispira sp.]